SDIGGSGLQSIRGRATGETQGYSAAREHMASLAPVFRVNAMTPRRKTLLVSLVGLLWAGGLLAAYWWFEIRYIRPFSEQTTLFSG
ncbi:hypothetical protein K3X19_14825, partial [Listeria monocytogenes]|nr:hypothetical protein [Listeria monocytogenes]